MSPFTVTVLNRDRYKLGEVGAPVSVKATPRHNQPGTAELTVRSSDRMAKHLLAEGALVILRYERLTRPLITGPVSLTAGSQADGTLTFTVTDSLNALWGVLGWPVPTAALDAQALAQDTRTGPAESVAKGVVLANATRLGLPLTTTPDEGRGATVTASWRMQPIADQLMDLLEVAGLGLRLQLAAPVAADDGRLRSPGLVVDCYVPQGYPRLLADRTGTVVDATFTRAAPTATRWVLGASEADPDDPTTRVFTGDVDTAAEALWGPALVAERFLDMRSLGSATGSQEKAVLDKQQTSALAQLDLRGRNEILLRVTADYQANPNDDTARAVQDAQVSFDEATKAAVDADAAFGQAITELEAARVAYARDIETELTKARADGAAKTGLSITLAETASFRYGDFLQVGDRVRVEVGGVQVVDTMREATFSWTTGDGEGSGLTVTPVVGEVTTPYRQLVSIVSGLLRAGRNQAVR